MLNTGYIDLNRCKIDPATIAQVSPRLVSYYRIIPVEHTKKSITIASAKPLDINILDDLRLLLSNKEIKTVFADERDIVEATNRYYGVGADTIEKMATVSCKENNDVVNTSIAKDVENSDDDASVTKFVNQLLFEAFKDRATDIHIEPYNDELKIRYRVDGVMYNTKVPPGIKNIQSAIISRIKIMANLDIAERRLPQDGRTKIRIGNDEVDLRVSILPTPFGEAAVVRLLSSNVFMGMENLGLFEKDIDALDRLIKAPHGIIFVTGPTGSGKTTTLYACLNNINDDKNKIITIEDPIEYQMKGILQIQVHPKIGLTFSAGLRSMLRHDPDIMMVGEVRDYETAEITIRVALTGHLVFSTLHTNDAAGGITRLIDMGIEPFLVASSVNAFIAQRLVRRICPHCKAEVRIDKEVVRELGLQKSVYSDMKIYEGKGCNACKNTGYKGRIAIYEILPITDQIRELILRRASSDQIKKKAISLGMMTLRQDGCEKIAKGVTTPSEVLRVTQQEEPENAL